MERAAHAPSPRFLHPLQGGPAGRGLAARARTCALSDLAAVLERVDGVDHARELAPAARRRAAGRARCALRADRIPVAGDIQCGWSRGEPCSCRLPDLDDRRWSRSGGGRAGALIPLVRAGVDRPQRLGPGHHLRRAVRLARRDGDLPARPGARAASPQVPGAAGHRAGAAATGAHGAALRARRAGPAPLTCPATFECEGPDPAGRRCASARCARSAPCTAWC